MFRARLILFIGIAILLAQLQCLALCAGDVCGADLAKMHPVPPCHHHRDQPQDRGPGTCWHPATPPAASPASAAIHPPATPAVGVTADSAAAPNAGALAAYLELSAFSPPGMVGVRLLRI